MRLLLSLRVHNILPCLLQCRLSQRAPRLVERLPLEERRDDLLHPPVPLFRVVALLLPLLSFLPLLETFRVEAEFVAKLREQLLAYTDQIEEYLVEKYIRDIEEHPKSP